MAEDTLNYVNSKIGSKNSAYGPGLYQALVLPPSFVLFFNERETIRFDIRKYNHTELNKRQIANFFSTKKTGHLYIDSEANFDEMYFIKGFLPKSIDIQNNSLKDLSCLASLIHGKLEKIFVDFVEDVSELKHFTFNPKCQVTLSTLDFDNFIKFVRTHNKCWYSLPKSITDYQEVIKIFDQNNIPSTVSYDDYRKSNSSTVLIYDNYNIIPGNIKFNH